MSKKRTIDAFFATPKSKKLHSEAITDNTISTGYTTHPAYPFPIPHLPASISAELKASAPRVSGPGTGIGTGTGRVINDQPDLDLLYFEPYMPRPTAAELFQFLRAELPFYRVEYDIRRGGISAHIRTPRWTTVFGIDATSRFAGGRSNSHNDNDNDNDNEEGTAAVHIVDARTGARVQVPPDPKDTSSSSSSSSKYYAKYAPRPIPECLDELRRSTEAATGCDFNFCLVNYYASGADSISFHSDDERFLGPMPAIASFSLGARRDFLMKHKPVPAPAPTAAAKEEEKEKEKGLVGQQKKQKQKDSSSKPLKLPLGSGDMILMRGPTQANWLHSIPKRSGKNEYDGGRINITFRKAMVRGGTENYYNYNVGTGPVYRWDSVNREMKPCNP